jgi:DNA repair protein RecO (recombination protein O)
MNSHRTQAIVLRRTNYGEADRIVQLLTPDGKRSVMARGVRREKSRLAGGIELFAVCDIVIGKGKGDLGVLTSARLVQFYRHILEDYDRMQFAYEVLKEVAKTSETVDEPEWYDITVGVLAALDTKTIPLALIKTWFYLHHSQMLGYELNLQRDVDDQPLVASDRYRYDIAERGLRRYETGEITGDHIKFMRLVGAKPLKVVAQVGGLEAILGDCLLLARQHAAL